MTTPNPYDATVEEDRLRRRLAQAAAALGPAARGGDLGGSEFDRFVQEQASALGQSLGAQRTAVADPEKFMAFLAGTSMEFEQVTGGPSPMRQALTADAVRERAARPASAVVGQRGVTTAPPSPRGLLGGISRAFEEPAYATAAFALEGLPEALSVLGGAPRRGSFLPEETRARARELGGGFWAGGQAMQETSGAYPQIGLNLEAAMLPTAIGELIRTRGQPGPDIHLGTAELAAAAADPLNLAPGVGWGTDIGRALAAGARRTAGRAAREGGEAALRQADAAFPRSVAFAAGPEDIPPSAGRELGPGGRAFPEDLTDVERADLSARLTEADEALRAGPAEPDAVQLRRQRRLLEEQLGLYGEDDRLSALYDFLDQEEALRQRATDETLFWDNAAGEVPRGLTTDELRVVARQEGTGDVSRMDWADGIDPQALEGFMEDVGRRRIRVGTRWGRDPKTGRMRNLPVYENVGRRISEGGPLTQRAVDRHIAAVREAITSLEAELGISTPARQAPGGLAAQPVQRGLEGIQRDVVRPNVEAADARMAQARMLGETPEMDRGIAGQLQRQEARAAETLAQAPPPRVRPAAAAQAPAVPEAPSARQAIEGINRTAAENPAAVTPEQASFAHIEAAAPDGGRLPPATPPAPPGGPPRGPRRGLMRTPDVDPTQELRRAVAEQLPGERLDQRLLIRHGAALRIAERRTRMEVDTGNTLLRKAGWGRRFQATVVPAGDVDIERADALYRVLHGRSRLEAGEITVPEGMEAFYEHVRGRMDFESAMRLDFDPEMATVQDYFYRGWKPPEAVAQAHYDAQGRLVYPPGFTKPRVDATYEEMRALGFEPLFWNAAEQYRVARLMGVRYREQMTLVAALKRAGDDLIRPHDGGPVPAGWRVPKVGPAFEGKPFATVDELGEPRVGPTRQWIVRDPVANALENMYGVKFDLGTVHVGGRDFNLTDIADWLAYTPKRAKLVLSFFQQLDFANRSMLGSWSNAVDALSRGQPIRAAAALAHLPVNVGDILWANVSPGRRLRLRQMQDSTTPFMRDRPGFHMKAVSEAGLNLRDLSLVPLDVDNIAREAAAESGLGRLRVVQRVIANIERGTRTGLFEGPYPSAVINDVRYNIAPMMARMHPDLSDAQLAARTAQAANIRYSLLPPEMSAVQNRFLRGFFIRLFFSMNEGEGLLRQAVRAIPVRGQIPARGGGLLRALPVKLSLEDRRFWITHWVGAYVSLMAMANAIHYITTREPLPRERYTPVSRDNWGPLPFGYNTKFASPDLPGVARGGPPALIDLVGQMDTAFRVLDPTGFVESRLNVPARAVVNQLSGTDFFDTPINDVGPGGIVSRTVQLIRDMFEPIGFGAAGTQIARQVSPAIERIVPTGEARLGTRGALIQATGANLRAMWNPELEEMALSGSLDPETQQRIVEELHRRAIESYRKNPMGTYEKDDPAEKSIRAWWANRAKQIAKQKREERAERAPVGFR